MSDANPSAGEKGSARPEASGEPFAWKRSFWSLFVTQFQGAFSDNVFKFLVIFTAMSLFPAEADQDRLITQIGALFAAPFILLSMTGGYCADRLSKRTVAIATKISEVGVMTLGAAGLYFQNLNLLLIVVFLMSAQSAFFGPTKYGLLPELLPEERLSWGNGMLGLGTFVSIIAGTIVAGALFEWLPNQGWSGVVLVMLAGIGLTASLGIRRLPAADPGKRYEINFIGAFWRQLKYARNDRVLILAMLGGGYFWFLGALVQQTVMIYGRNDLGLSFFQTSSLYATMAVGIGVGSFAAGYISGRKIEYGLIPLGALGLSGFSLILGLPDLSPRAFTVFLAALGFFGGFYIVPINALVQHRPDKDRKGSIIAAEAFLSWLGILLAAGAYFVLKAVGLSTSNVFITISVFTLLATVFAVRLMPDSLVRLLLVLLTHTLYRIRVSGRDNIPEKGGALLVSNHLSQVDALLMAASTDRPIRFLMYQGMYERSWIKPFARMMKVIPISAHGRPREMIQALRTAGEAIQGGEVVCVFAEGQITRIGQMLPFRRGFERIMKGIDAPIIPVCFDGVWGSIFSFEKGRFLWKWPRRIPYPVTVHYGKAMPPTANHLDVRQAVQELGAEAWAQRKTRMDTIHRAFIRTARKHPFRFAMGDEREPRLTYRAALDRSVFLARRLKPVWESQSMVGILLPPSVEGALVNFAALLLGKTPVNLDCTASDETIASCTEQSGLRTIVTSKAFRDNMKPAVHENGSETRAATIFLEEIAQEPRAAEKLVSRAAAFLLPAGILERWLRKGAAPEETRRTKLDDLATVIFPRDDAGDPKGVMLSHYNVMSNIEQLEQTFALSDRDRFLGVLPFHLAYGFTGTLCLPCVLGSGVVFHSAPLEAKAIGGLAREYAITVLPATPSLLQTYLRGCEPGDFGGLQFVIAGAEELQDELAAAFEEKFGVRPLEGYGCAECSPVVAVNSRDFRAAGFRQVGARRGKIGHPLPGMTVRILDPRTREPLPVGEAGLLLVKGPNVMKGYLGNPEKTAKVLIDGWFETGDLASLDKDGFLQIKKRQRRI